MAGMCNISFIKISDAYLHGTYFLFWLYRNMRCITPHVTLLYWFSSSQIHTHLQLLKTVHWVQRVHRVQHHISYRNTACSVLVSSENTHETISVFLQNTCVPNVSLLIDLVGTQIDLVYSWKCHSLSYFLRVIGWTNHKQILVYHLTTT
jgi:hypothetical protein